MTDCFEPLYIRVFPGCNCLMPGWHLYLQLTTQLVGHERALRLAGATADADPPDGGRAGGAPAAARRRLGSVSRVSV